MALMAGALIAATCAKRDDRNYDGGQNSGLANPTRHRLPFRLCSHPVAGLIRWLFQSLPKERTWAKRCSQWSPQRRSALRCSRRILLARVSAVGSAPREAPALAAPSAAAPSQARAADLSRAAEPSMGAVVR